MLIHKHLNRLIPLTVDIHSVAGKIEIQFIVGLQQFPVFQNVSITHLMENNWDGSDTI